jgi:hypothetical protein
MFHFPSFPPNTLYIQVRVTGHISSRVPPFGNPRITARLPAPRGLSQAPTSFIGSWCQGIHRAPLKTFTTQHKIAQIQRCSRPLYSSQATGSHRPHTRHQPQTRKPETVYLKAATHTHHTPAPKSTSKCERCPESKHKNRSSRMCPLPQDPTACHKPSPTPAPAFQPQPSEENPSY